jgi:hypothetical protein
MLHWGFANPAKQNFGSPSIRREDPGGWNGSTAVFVNYLEALLFIDGFVKGPDAALGFSLCHCGVQ